MSIKSSASALGFVAAVMVMLTGCGDTTQKEQSPAKVTAIAGSAVQQVQLTERAVQRLGIATKPLQVTTVKLAGHADARKVIPYSAVVYDTDCSALSTTSAVSNERTQTPADPHALDHQLEPAVPPPRRRRGDRHDGPGHHRAPEDARRRVPRVRAAAGAHPDCVRCPFDLGCRAARHGAAGGRAERHPGPG